MDTIIDTICSFIFNNLLILHIIIIGLLITKTIHFSLNKRSYWNVYQWLYFDAIEINHSISRKGVLTKAIQNTMTRIILALAITDGILSLLYVLINSNAH